MYEWIKFPGLVCRGYCDLIANCNPDKENTLYILCEALRNHVGSGITHKFKEIK